MDGGYRNTEADTNSAFSYAFNSNDQSRKEFVTDTTLSLKFPGASIANDSNLKVTKRKCLDYSLCSLNSFGRSSITRETDEVCSTDLSLSFQRHQGGDKHNLLVSTPKRDQFGPDLDLKLSLSLGPSESNVTTTFQHKDISPRYDISPISISFQNQASSSSNPAISTSGNTIQQNKRCNIKKCEITDCKRGARGASGLCISHGGGSRCQKPGCQKGAEGKTTFCKGHGGGRRCQYLGCTKSAEGRTEFCIRHGGGRRCTYEGCTRASRGKSGLCIGHGGGKRCQKENCTKSAEGLSGLCISHGGGRRCQYPECSKGAQGSTMFCKKHGGGKRCTYPECTKGAEGSTLFCKGHGGGKRCTFLGCPKSVHGGTHFCVSHGGGKRCAKPDCTKSARGKSSCCVRHGGGKRCIFLGCDKSAQGRTDFCKAHGGGKKCAWNDGVQCGLPARGKKGLCAAHDDQRVHGGATLGPLSGMADTTFLKKSEILNSRSSMISFHPGTVTEPERRVHGGRAFEIGSSSAMYNNSGENMKDN